METLYNLLDPYINFEKFPPHQLVFFGLGFVFWALTYKEILQGVRKYKIVEIPMVVAALDITWEFNWAFVLKNSLGLLFSFGCAVWFFLDCFINYNTLRYGRKLVTNPWIAKYYFWIWLFFIVGSFGMVYYMSSLHEDNGIGVISAYQINLLISALYLYQLLNYPELRGRGFSYKVAWNKFLGTGFISVGSLMHYQHNGYILTMAAMVTVMDIAYLILFKNYKPETLSAQATN
jgi:hypothetical protein